MLTGAQLTQYFSNAFLWLVNLHIISVIKKAYFSYCLLLHTNNLHLIVAQWNSECFKLIFKLEVIQLWLLKPCSLSYPSFAYLRVLVCFFAKNDFFSVKLCLAHAVVFCIFNSSDAYKNILALKDFDFYHVWNCPCKKCASVLVLTM